MKLKLSALQLAIRPGYKNTPHVCFLTETPLTGKDDLLRQLEPRLRERFKSLRIVKVWFSKSWGAVIESEQGTHPIVLGKSKYRDHEWILVVTPANTSKAESNLEDVMEVCRELHTLLGEIPGITSMRWYFEWAGDQTEAVLTPDELPWNRGAN